MNTIISSHKEPKLTLVGAGPGDPELLTIKAVNALKNADIVLYDALVAEEILQYIPVGTPALPVGKRAGAHAFSQEEINELIVAYAYLYGHVVRLKGGDPFVFGRGVEEIEFASSRGVTTAWIPGITSAIAAPGAAGIPVTARGVSESFWVITGTTKTGTISNDITLAARSTATVVILMGINRIEEIMKVFLSHGKAEVPAAVIQHGTLEDQRSIVGTVANIAAVAEQENIGSPSVIIVGDVVKYAASVETLMPDMQRQIAAFQ